ncbi:hypothetical protein POVCU2_0098350 [Plasmodium ovale curtisi]|uniref:Uncharacterized protein n=1 Tax=Plasmodium ovale curtisi TaxID=864141 RepID=A0A1A8WV63_PLAOA|nr:hypothetical protein POVCU1_014080 [Plasmodium ovale curtisi]SBS95758.1 hypothetical protein POVCU2_0098350 [Plasmodium ovale curtisi]
MDEKGLVEVASEDVKIETQKRLYIPLVQSGITIFVCIGKNANKMHSSPLNFVTLKKLCMQTPKYREPLSVAISRITYLSPKRAISPADSFFSLIRKKKHFKSFPSIHIFLSKVQSGKNWKQSYDSISPLLFVQCN